LYYEPGMASDMIFTDDCYDNYSSALIQLVFSMIETNPRNRPTAQYVLSMCTAERRKLVKY